MANKSKIDEYNSLLLSKLSVFLNAEPDYIKKETVELISRECDLGEVEAYAYLLASAIYLDVADDPSDRELFEMYFPRMLKKAELSEYLCNPYLQEIKLREEKIGTWELTKKKYAPYEAFVYDDMIRLPDGRIIPQIAFFDKEYSYPCVLESGREWMTVTPNEVNTMKKSIADAKGKVLTFGLGLGYFAFMAARKDEVESVTVVEYSEGVIDLFERCVLPQMKCKDKIRIVRSDAYRYAEQEMKREGYDFVFCDIWHDPSDGVDAYLRFKQYEKDNPKTCFAYWIEETLKCYM